MGRQDESGIRLCIPLEPWDEAHLLEANLVAQHSGQGIMNAGIGAKDLHFNMQRIPTYKIPSVVGLIVRKRVCAELLSAVKAPNSIMEEVYVKDGLSIRLLRPADYLLAHPEIQGTPKSLWRFGVYSSGIRSKNLSRQRKLKFHEMIYVFWGGSESDFNDLKSEEKIKDAASPPKKEVRRRNSTIREHVRDAIEQLVTAGEDPNAKNVMHYLMCLDKKINPDIISCDANFIVYNRGRGDPDKLTLKGLRDMLYRLRKEEPLIFTENYYKKDI